MNLTLNHKDESTTSIDISIYFNMFKIGLYSFIFALGIFGNIVVVITTYKFKHLRKPINILICNLCISDILLLLLGIPLFALESRLISNHITCRILPVVIGAVISTLVLSLISIGVERYVSIRYHFKKFKLNIYKTKIVIMCIYLISITTAVPLGFEHIYKMNKCISQWSQIIQIICRCLFIFFQYILPLCILTYVYSRSWHRIRRKNKITIRMSHSKRNSRSDFSKSSNHIDIQEPFPQAAKSTSNNHLVGDKTLKRRSWSTGSLQSVSAKDSSVSSGSKSVKAKTGTFRRSVSVESDLNSKQSGTCTNRRKISRSGSFRDSFRGSINRAQRSLTNIITGADIEAAQQMYAKERSKQTVLTLKMFSYLLLLFGFCMLPHHILELLHTLNFAGDHEETYLFLLHIFVYINASLNPWLYAGMNTQYRSAFRAMFQVKQKNLSNMMKKNLLRSPSGTLIFEKQQTKRNWLIILKQYFCISEEEQISYVEGLSISSIMDIKNGTESIKSTPCSSPRIKSRNQSKYSRSESIDPDSDIPISLPIIMISNYDDEMGEENIFDDVLWYYEIDTKL